MRTVRVLFLAAISADIRSYGWPSEVGGILPQKIIVDNLQAHATVLFPSTLPAGTLMNTIHPTQFASFIEAMVTYVHGANVKAGWWTDLNTGERKERNVGELLMLCVSELAEAMEGHRKNLKDDKLKHRPMIEVELADTIIRIFDLAGGFNLDLGGALVEKLAYNAVREDHKIENRKSENGKKY